MRADVSFDRLTDALIDEWRRLYAMAEPNFFLSPPWIETWLGVMPQDVKVGVVRVFDDLRGIFGMAIVGAPPRKSFAAFAEARLHETGAEAIDRIYVEYNDVLLARDAPPDSRAEVVAAIVGAFPEADEFVFRNVRPAMVAAIETLAAAERFELRILLAQPTFQINLDTGEGALIDRFSSSLRSKIRRSIRRYEERGPLTLERAAPGPERTIAWTELMRLHEQTWSRRGLAGVFRNSEFMTFHGTLLERYPAAVDLVRLIVAGETVGVLYNFIADGRVYNYQSGFRYESDNQLVPGFVCHALAAERYRADGFRIYDMMGGDAEYKRRLGEEGETLRTVVLTRRGLRSIARSLQRRMRRSSAEETHQT